MTCVCRLIISCLAFMVVGIPVARADAPATSPVQFDMKAYERHRVLAAADKYMAEKPITITAFKADRSPGGAHDFYSEADYAWPDPNNPAGPYIGRDGESNPNYYNDHRLAMRRMSIQVPALISAYLITGDQKYARHAVDHLRAWFVDADTKMNPSLPYAQAVRNKDTGNAYGIIDTLHFVEVARSVVLLRKHGILTPEEDAGITKWFAEYIQWLTTSAPGIKEGNAKNNHATCYWLQIATFAAVTRDDAMIAEARKRYKEQLLPQMADDGSFPLELKRTKPYGYSLFNLDQMVMLCQVLSTPEDNLWTFALPDGRTIRKGVEFLYPYVKDKSKWPYKHDVMFWDQWPVRSPTWLYAGRAFDEPKYIELWKSLEADPTNEEVIRNLEIRQPVIWENED